MKKFFYFLCLISFLVASMPLSAEVRTIKTKSEFESFFFTERSNDQCDTIYVESAGKIISLSNGKNLPNSGKIYIIGKDDENGQRSGLGWQWNLPLNTQADRLSIFIENLLVECNGGNKANSKYLFQTKDTLFHYIDSLAFRNCEIRNYNRGIFRVQPGERSNGSKDAGELNYFAIENCIFHDGYALEDPTPMPMFRMDMRVSEMLFRNNLFYDLGYVNTMVQFSTMTEDAARVDLKFTFENNTFIGWCRNSSLMNFDSYVGQMSEFAINNNLFMVPNWKDEYNNCYVPDSVIEANPDTLNNPQVHYIASIQYGLVECKNNVLCGYKAPRENLNEEQEGAWLVADTLHLRMEDVDFSWSKFTDVQNDLFNIWKGEKIYTSGVDGAPIGAISSYSDEKKEVVLLDVSVSGSKSASVTVFPQQAKYLTGDVITVTANCNGSLNTFKGWSNGVTEATQTIVLTGNLSLTAEFEELNYYAVWTFENVTGKDMDAPMPADFVQTEAVQLHYATWKDGAYTDSITGAFRTRLNKMPADIKPCVFIRSTMNQLDTLKKADYVYFEVKNIQKGDYLSLYIGTENYVCRENNIDYSLDNGASWLTFAVGVIPNTDSTNLWIPVKALVPDELEGKTALFRIQGNVESDRVIGKDVYEAITDTEKYPDGLASILTNEWLYIAELSYIHSVPTAIRPVEMAKPVAGPIYDIFGRRVKESEQLAPGFYIQDGKKFIVR